MAEEAVAHLDAESAEEEEEDEDEEWRGSGSASPRAGRAGVARASRLPAGRDGGLAAPGWPVEEAEEEEEELGAALPLPPAGEGEVFDVEVLGSTGR